MAFLRRTAHQDRRCVAALCMIRLERITFVGVLARFEGVVELLLRATVDHLVQRIGVRRDLDCTGLFDDFDVIIRDRRSQTRLRVR